ncbi:MAG: metallo-beta-lactamase family protein [Chloroflexota bacterium]|nr:metallo-beta-lactamase family protein [Chloroflexota bacterium]
MKIRFYGAARTVTGSQHLLEINGKQLLLECGIFQGRRRDFYARNATFPFDPHEIDAVILSHAHIDHSGNLPNLVKQGYHNPIYTTPPTAELASIMLRDSGHIYEEDAEYINKKKRKHGDAFVEPLYTIADAERVPELFRLVGYDKPFEPIPGVTAHLVDAGHILGSAAVVLDIEEDGQKKRLWFSGDIGRYKLPLLADPVLPEDVNILMMECTYGDKPHRDPDEAYVEFRDVVKKTHARGGKVVVPAFAVGRTQELVYDLNRMITEGEVPHLPVFVDSPLAVHASDVFRKHPDYFDDETHQFVATGHHPALDFPGLTYTHSVEESKAINRVEGPAVIISASGMAETGRILHHLVHNIEDPRSTICIVSWQAPYTLGRRLAERQRKVRIFGEEVPVKAEIATIGGLSAHAGQNMLLRYAQAANSNGLKQIFLVHGEEDAASVLMGKMKEAGIQPVTYPEYGEVVEF